MYATLTVGYFIRNVLFYITVSITITVKDSIYHSIYNLSILNLHYDRCYGHKNPVTE